MTTPASLSSQIIANHHMQSISFASGGDTVRWVGGPLCPLSPQPSLTPAGPPAPHAGELNLASLCHLSLQDMTDYVAYVAKDPINQRGEPRGAQGPGPGAGLCWRSQAR